MCVCVRVDIKVNKVCCSHRKNEGGEKRQILPHLTAVLADYLSC